MPTDGGEQAGGLQRRATSSPSEYVIPADAVPAEFRRRVATGDYDIAMPRPASTVALVRAGIGSPEVLLVRRPSTSRFAANAWVFPGGVVDTEDGAAWLAEEAATWAVGAGFGDPATAGGHLVAAVRELWEETGIFLGTTSASPTRLSQLRDELLAGASFAQLAEAGGLEIDPFRFRYLARWITPDPETKRYDARFFLANASPTAEVTLRGGELEEARWMAIEDAVRDFEEGELHMLPPTVHTLRLLSGVGSVAEMYEALEGHSAGEYLPRMSLHPDGILIRVHGPPDIELRRASSPSQRKR